MSSELRVASGEGLGLPVPGAIAVLCVAFGLGGCTYSVVPKDAEPPVEITVSAAEAVLPVIVRAAGNICAGHSYEIRGNEALRRAVAVVRQKHPDASVPAETRVTGIEPTLECHAERWRTRCTAEVETMLEVAGEPITHTGHAEGPAGWRCQKLGQVVLEALGEALVGP